MDRGNSIGESPSRKRNCKSRTPAASEVPRLGPKMMNCLAKLHCFSIVLCYLLLFQLVVPLRSAQNDQPPLPIHITVVEGEGAINDVRQRSTREPLVRVEDQNNRPVTGAAVVFTLPTEGPSGEFRGGAKNLTVMTDDQGLAPARGLKPNEIPGKLQIHVNASYRGQTARIIITQFNMTVPGAAKSGGSGKIVAILLIVGAAAAGGAVLGLRQSGHSSSTGSSPAAPTPITITPGTGTIGPPH